MEWKKDCKYFFKLNDGTCLTGSIIGFDSFGENNIIKILDKFNKEIGFRESQIMKYELLTKTNELLTNLNNVNNSS